MVVQSSQMSSSWIVMQDMKSTLLVNDFWLNHTYMHHISHTSTWILPPVDTDPLLLVLRLSKHTPKGCEFLAFCCNVGEVCIIL